MSINEILQFILLPAMGWLLVTQYKLAQRLTAIEARLEILLPGYCKSEPKIKRKSHELRSVEFVD